ncbi:MAG: hypothetical protein EHM24_28885, partial [Acidobacteria bacterium]
AGIAHAAHESGRLRYVLLVGDDHWDPAHRVPSSQPSFLPSAMFQDGANGRVPSETRYADLDGDGAPDLAIGRLPAASAEEALALAAKVERQRDALAYAAGRHLFAVDDGAPFLQRAQAAMAQLPNTSTSVLADLNQGIQAAEDALAAATTSGVEAMHYFGHGSVDLWADEWLLDSRSAAAFAGRPESLLFTWACYAQDYQNVFDYGEGPVESVGESLLKLPTGGVLASFGPAGITDERLQVKLQTELYPRLFHGELTLGEAIRQAKAEVLRADPATAPVVEGWNLLGDPALRLPAPRQ